MSTRRPSYHSWILLLLIGSACHSLGQMQLGNTPNQTQQPFTVPIQNYSVIDLSGSDSPGDTGAMSYNDANVAWFAYATGTMAAVSEYGTGSSGAIVETWANGALVPGNFRDVTYPNEDANIVGEYEPYNLFYQYGFYLLDTSGNLFGSLAYNNFNADTMESLPTSLINAFEAQPSVGFIGLPEPPFYSVVPDSHIGLGYPGGLSLFDLLTEFVDDIPTEPIYIQEATQYGYCGGFEGWAQIYQAPYTEVAPDLIVSFIYSSTGNQWYFFANPMGDFSASTFTVTSGSNFSIINSSFVPTGMNDVGGVIGVTGTAPSLQPTVWTTGTFTSLGLASAADINNQGEIVGTGTDSNNPSTEGAIVYSGSYGAPAFFRDTLPTNIQGQISGVQPLMVSNTNALDGSFTVFSNALDADGIPVGPPVQENFIWRRDMLGNWTFAKCQLPDGTSINDYITINSSGIIAATGYPPWGSDTTDALLLLPVSFQQVYPSSGFDPVSIPHWLMVPVSGSNTAIALTPASSNLSASFPILPSSPDPTVSPTSTSSSNQTITVSGTGVGESFQVQVGAGTTIPGAQSIAGLCIDVKPMKTDTVAIHAVTQHYTQAMAPPSPSGGFTAGTVCISATGGALWSTPTPPDQYGSDESLTIVTGSDGICHTPANPHDRQVIPVGWGIPEDIVPQDTPSASDLQTYLSQVFGKQANLYLTVTRNDFSVNYDLNKNGILDIHEGQNTAPSEEQQTIEKQATAGVTFNVFYMADFQGIPLSGTIPDHFPIGIAYFPRAIAYVRDYPNDTLESSAHEIGHLLDLAHTDREYLPDLTNPNPASISKIPDPHASYRLMYPSSSGTNTLLIQPEWDIVNPNHPPE